MRRQMAHRVRPSARDDRPARRRPAGSHGRGPRRFLGPAIIGGAAVALLAIIVLDGGAAGAGPGGPDGPGGPAGPDGRVAAASGVPSPSPRATAPPCDPGDILTPNQAPDDWPRAILDTSLMLSPDAAPTDLVKVTEAGIAGSGKVRELVVEDLRALAAAARANGVTISVDSAYRSYDQQVATFSSYAKAYGQEEALRTVARPGHSEHQLGTTIDFAGDLEWLASNAPTFGFVMSYPADVSPARTCYRPEAWHFRYVGRDVALRVVASGLSLREWLWLHQP